MNAPAVSLAYKHLSDGTPVFFSLYPPTRPKQSPVPAVVYYHGGGLTVGNRDSWHPAWLQRRANAHGFAFLSPDYRLMPPATGHSVLEDIKDLFIFLSKAGKVVTMISHDSVSVAASQQYEFEIDKDAIVVAGSSAGGLCAYLAAVHCYSPRPKAVLSMYGMGGDFFTPHYLLPKKEVFFRGRELLEPADFSDYLYPLASNLRELVDSPLAYHTEDYHIPRYPANPRMLLGRLYLQLGVFLDYYAGAHSPSLSEALRQSLGTGSDRSLNNSDSQNRSKEERNGLTFADSIPECHRCLFPQLWITSGWPPTVLCHGTADTAVSAEESRMLGRSLVEAGIAVKSFEFDGEEHSFDFEAGAEEKHGEVFDKIVATLVEWVME
ncbi:hypothetical protein AX15_002890 [Amanita polypyramis BW_CC]|nr:hypothetical protein AX15_002890 [Amanita polypyramis BW_CC]